MMTPESSIWIVLAILFLSSFVRSAFGFGDALLAMPLLAMAVGIRTATPLVALIASTIALAILLGNWRQIRFAPAWRLIVSTLAGIPLGLWFLKGTYDTMLKLVLALVIIGFSGWSLLAHRHPTIKHERWAPVFGFAGGILGGAYNTNGPAVVIYGTLRHWPPASFRATLQGYFFPTGLLILMGHGGAGLWTGGVLRLYLYSLPVVLAAVWVGDMVHRRIPPGRFDRVVHILLLLIGAVLIVQTLTGI